MNVKKVGEGQDKGRRMRRLSIEVEVVFGNPQLGCRGSGICRVNTKAAWSRNRREKGSAIGYLAARGGCILELKFPVKNLKAGRAEAHLDEEVMKVPAEIVLPGPVVRALHLAKGSTIAAGAYPIKDRKGCKVILLAAPG